MHLIENYALTAGCKISEPHIEPLFFPMEAEKYITIHGGSGMDSKNYSYFENVIKLIKPELESQGIKIFQIGEKSDQPIKECESLLGKTELRQTFFVLKNSMLHLGNDSFSTHVSAFYRTPVVAVYGPVIVNTCKPYWGDESIQSLISPDYSTRKPSFSIKENPKRVDEIFPDHIASECLRLLKLNNAYINNEPIHLGSSFHTQVIDVVPDQGPTNNIKILDGSLVNLRLDYTNEPNGLEDWLSHHKCALFLNKETDINVINKYKHNIKKIYLYISDNTSEDFIHDIISTGIKHKLLYTGKNISSIRLKFFHQNIYQHEKLSNKDLDNVGELCDNCTYYESSLNIIKQGKIYSCKAALDLGIEKQDVDKIINNKNFYQEIDYFKIFKNDNKN